MSTTKKYDLEDRTLAYAKNVQLFVKKIAKSFINNNSLDQLLRSSSSVGANYIEANESLGKKDFRMRIKIARKEAKESIFWLKLLDLKVSPELEETKSQLIDESRQIMFILGAILKNSE